MTAPGERLRAAEDACIALLRTADKVNARIATVHERQPCPTCHAPVGEVCRHVGNHRPLTHPHEARWTREIPKR